MTFDAGLVPKLKAPAPGARKPSAPEHSTQALLTQRVMQMIGGYPDGNDSNHLRHDPVLQMLVGKAAPGTTDATLASQPTMSRLDNGFTLRQLVLDLGSTACIVYGQQELGMFSTHVGDTCLMPFHLYEGQRRSRISGVSQRWRCLVVKTQCSRHDTKERMA